MIFEHLCGNMYIYLIEVRLKEWVKAHSFQNVWGGSGKRYRTITNASAAMDLNLNRQAEGRREYEREYRWAFAEMKGAIFRQYG